MTDKTLTTTDTDTEAPIAGELVAQFCTLDDIKLLRNKYQGLVIQDDESYAQVKAALSDVKAARVGIEKDRKALKQKALDYGRAVDAHAKELTAAIKPLEDALALEKTNVDEARAFAKAHREAVEAERVAAIRAGIDAIKGAPHALADDAASWDIEFHIAELRALAPTEAEYQEFTEVAQNEHTHAINLMVRLYDKAVETEKAELEIERLTFENAKLEQQKRDQELAHKAQLANAAARKVLYKIQSGDVAYGGFMGPILKEWMQDGTVESYTSDEAMLHDLQAAGYKAEQEQAQRDREATEATKAPRPKLVAVTDPETVTEDEAIADSELAADRDADVSDLEPLREQLLHLEIPLTLRTDQARGALTFILETRHQAIALIDQLTPLKETQIHVK